METSLLLAKLIGTTMLIFGLHVVIGVESMRRVGREFLDSEALIFISGIITLPVGLAIVITHNVWTADWRVLITLFGWIAVVAGVARLTLSRQIMSLGEKMLESRAMIMVPGAVMALVGGYLAWRGFLG